MSRWVNTFVKYFYGFSLVSGQVLLFIMTGLIAFDVFARAFIGRSTMISQDVSGYLMVAITFLGLAHTLREGRHISVEILTRKLSPHRQRQIEILVYLLCIVFMAWLTWTTSLPVVDAYATGQVAVTLSETPMWIPLFFVPFGSGMLTLAFVIEFVRKIGHLGYQGASGPGSKADLGCEPPKGWGI